MNRLLIIIILILVPVTFVTNKKEVEVVGVKDEVYSLEISKQEILLDKRQEEQEETKTGKQVLISNNKDKSNPYYMDLEEYIIGVVAGEMPASFNKEALKAQAVAARSFALNKQASNQSYVLSTTINDQVYINNEAMKKKWGEEFDYYYEKIKEAVKETEGEVLTYNGDIISAYYFAISNGYTDNAANVFNENREYLVSVESSWDKNYKSYKSELVMSREDFCKKLGLEYGTILISNVNRASNNYIRDLVINGKKFTGLEVFNKLSLKSTDFTIQVRDGKIVITTYGFGHGVGMSQYGAQGMANEGYSYQDILKHYYQNTTITKI